MAIPKEITALHIAKAIKDVKKNYDRNHASTEHVLLVDGVALEPKRIISRAAFYATGKELDFKEFSGGDEANNFLQQRGFKTTKGGTK